MKQVMIAVMLMVGFGLSAQRGHGPGHGNPHKQDLSAEQSATLQSKRLTLALELNSSQQKEVQDLLESEFQWRKQAMAERKATKDSTAQADPQARYERMNAHLDHQIEFERQMKEILTEAQFEKWKKVHKHRKGKKGHRGRQHGRRGK